jgi:hypothetical protein
MAMIFTLVTVLKDSAELIITERQNAKQALADQAAAKLEEEENLKFQGEAVTRESFLAWRARFFKEVEDEEQRKQDEKELEEESGGRKRAGRQEG